jgi:queuosine precursor transporter
VGIYNNELVFILYTLFVLGGTLFALKFDKSVLIALIAVQSVLANMLVVKQIDILNLGTTSSEVFIVSTMLGITLLQEYYGEDVAKQATYISFASSIFYMLSTQLHLLYMPNSYDLTHNHFAAIFAFAPRIVISSIIVYFLAQRLNIVLYRLINRLFKNISVSIKSFFSVAIAQTFDTALFAGLALYGIVGSIFSVIMVSIAIKIIVIIISMPLIQASAWFISKKNV